MEKLSLKEIQKIEIEILSKIDKICKNNNITYSLAAGSVIGAIRHKGFIPWDDDIDIIMSRKDYEKFKDIMTSQNYKDIKYLSCEIQNDYWWPYAKVVSLKTEAQEKNLKPTKDYGVFVDIFPLDNIPNDEQERKKYFNKLKIIRNLYLLKLFGTSTTSNNFKKIIKKILLFFLTPISSRHLLLKFNTLVKKYKDTPNCNNLGLLVTETTIKRNIIYPNNFLEKIIYTEFENKKFTIIENYDKYLKELYGDYMKLPPKEEQISNHHWEILKLKNT